MTVTTINNYNPLIFQVSLYALEKVIENTVNLATAVFSFSKATAMLCASAVAIPDLIINYCFKADSTLCKITLLPCKVLNIGFDRIEDLVIRVNRKVLDILNIRLSLPISRLQLKAALQKWENENPLEREERQKASDRIIYHSGTLTFWEPFRELVVTITNYQMQSTLSVSMITLIFSIITAKLSLLPTNHTCINLSGLRLRSLPPVFHNKNFSNLYSLQLDDNELTSLPQNLLSGLSDQTEISIKNNKFSALYLLSLERLQNDTNYSGPRISPLSFYSRQIQTSSRRWHSFLRDDTMGASSF